MGDKEYRVDRTDLRILRALQNNARAPLHELAETAHLSVSQTQRRVRQLENAGVIQGYSVRINALDVGLNVVAYAEITLARQDTESATRFHEAVQSIPEVQECHRVSGTADYLLKILAPDLPGYSSLAQRTILAIPEVDKITTMIVFESAKNTSEIPLGYARP